MMTGSSLKCILALSALLFHLSSAQSRPSSTYGSEFFIGFMRNVGGGTLTNFRLTIGTTANGTVPFVVESNAGVIFTGTVMTDSPVVVSVPNDRQVINSDFSNREKGVRVYSTGGDPLYIVAENFVPFVNHGVYLAYPSLSFGIDQYQYGVVSADDSSDTLNSQFLLVGCENDTSITITPTQPINLPMNLQQVSTAVSIQAGNPSHTFTLNRMQTLLVSSVDDLTGTKIISNKPLTVISGHECANIPLTEGGCEPFAVQVPPAATWGTQFLLAPFTGRDGPQAYKAISSSNNATIIYTCGSESSLTPENSILSFFSASYCYLQSTDPIFLTEFSFGGSIDNLGDPSISIISPLDQYIKAVDFVSLPRDDFDFNYISVTVAAEHFDIESILLDDVAIDCVWEDIMDSDANIVGHGCSKLISSCPDHPRKHTVSHSAENGMLSVLVYGFNSIPALGYAYLAGQVLGVAGNNGGNIDLEINFLPILDLTTLPAVSELDRTQVDATSDPITIPSGFIFGNEIVTLAYVNENGIISFNNPWKFSIPERFPTNFFWTRMGRAVAPFWSDNDIRREGRVRYATFHSDDAATNPQGKNWLDQVNMYIQNTQEEGEEPFIGEWVLTVDWSNVHPSPHGDDDHRGISEDELAKTNSYQATIITDVVRTYTIFSYMCGEVQWSSLGRNRAAVVGLNSAGNFFYNHPLAGFSGIGDAVSCTFNIGKRRKRQNNMPNNVVINLPTDRNLATMFRQCSIAVNRDKLAYLGTPDTPQTLADMLEPCPCTAQQAVTDNARFRPFTQPGNCYVSARPIDVLLPTIGLITLTQMCCYTNGALQVSSDDAGTMLFHNPITDTQRYTTTDEAYRTACCDANSCERYFDRRVINTCQDYTPPSIGYGSGDPHYRTLDGKFYDFQGNGEYVLLRVLPENGNSLFILQGRMQPWSPGSGVSVHIDFAFGGQGSAFHFERNFRVHQILPAPSTDITNQLVIGQPWLDATNKFQLTRINHRTLVVSHFESGIGLRLDDNRNHLNYQVSVPRSYENRIQGFQGNLDGNVNNEFHTRQNVIVPNLNSNRDIYPHLEQHWKFGINEYPDFFQMNRRRRQVDPDFVPIFFDELNVTDDVSMMCQGNQQCILDLIVTGDLEIAVDTLDNDRATNTTVDMITNFPPNISASAVFSVTLGQESAHTLVVEDTGDDFMLSILEEPMPNFVLDDMGDGVYIFRWNLQEVTTAPLVFVANDSQGASSIFIPNVEVCACVNGGNCTKDGLVSSEATIVLNCVCPEAFSGVFCEEDRNGCSEIQCFEGVECMDVPAPGVGAMCGSCPDGYTGDATKCYDIDECEANAMLCDQVCENTDGSFACACLEGYQMTTDGMCQDIDECAGINSCQQLCENTVGSYSCSCNAGFTLQPDGRNCTADMPCGGTCSFGCAVVNGQEQCFCPTGFELQMPEATQCVDIDECDATPCGQLCNNTEGSFECSCQSGYQLQDDRRSCLDVDECLDAAINVVNLCEDNSECVNTEGSFLCPCVPGYEMVNETCTRIMNEPPPPPPPVVTPTSGAENSVNYTAPNLTPETFTPSLQQAFREVTSRVVNEFCKKVTCRVVLNSDMNETVVNLTVSPVSVAIPVSLIDQNDEGHLMFQFYIQLANTFLSFEDLQLAVQQSDEEYRNVGLLPPITTQLQVENMNTTVFEMSSSVEVCVRLVSSSVPFAQVPRNVSVDILIEPDGVAELSTREIIFSPLVADLVKCVNISYGDDNLVETDMRFAVTFSPVHGDDSFEGGNVITITVIDDEVVMFSVVEPTLSIVESNDMKPVEVCLALLFPLVEFLRTEIYIEVNTVSLSADGDDYEGNFTQALLFSSTRNTTRCASINISGDSLVEDEEMFAVIFTSNDGRIEIVNDSITVMIVDDDDPVFAFSPLVYNELEMNMDYQVMIVEVSGVTFGPGVFRTLSINSQTSQPNITCTQPATAGSDFVSIVNTVVNAVGSFPLPFNFTLLQDDIDEEDEMFNLVLSVGAGVAASIAPGSATATITITDEDLAQFQFTMNPVSATEDTPTIDVCVELVGSRPSTDVTLSLDPSPDTADGTDFGDETMDITFPALSAIGTEMCTSFSIVDDGVVEGVESFTVTGSGGSFVGGQDSTLVNIANNDNPVFGFSPLVYTELETDAHHQVVITEVNGLTFAPGISRTLTINSQTVGPGLMQPATGGSDFVAVDNAVVDVDSSPFPFNFTLMQDNIHEADEMFNLVLSVGAGVAASIAPGSATATITITDEDLARFQFMTNPVSATEDTPTIDVCVELVGSRPSTDVTLSLDPSPGTADGTDFGDETMEITFQALSAINTEMCASFSIVDDGVVEGVESFTVTGSGGSFVGGQDSTLVNIANNDNPVFGFNPLAYNEVEADMDFQVMIVEVNGLTFAPGVSRTLTINSGPGNALSATAGSDFVAVINAEIDVGSSPFPFNFTLLQDDIDEADEMFNLVLSVGAGVAASIAPGSATATITITDEDLTQFQFTTNLVPATEDTPTIDVCVELVGSRPSTDVTLSLDPSPGTADGTDFGDETMEITFPALSAINTEMCASFSILDDSVVESVESFTVTGSGGSFVGEQDSIQVDIADTDLATVGFATTEVTLSESDEQPTWVCLVVSGEFDGRSVDLTLDADDASSDAILLDTEGLNSVNVSGNYCFSLIAVNDQLVEDKESFTIGVFQDNILQKSLFSLLVIDNNGVVLKVWPTQDVNESSAATRALCVELIDVGGGLDRNVSVDLEFLLEGYTTQGDFTITGYVLYFNSTSVVGDMSCVQFQTVMDTIVEEDEVVTFRAVPRNILEVFYEENDLISLTVFDNDGVLLVTTAAEDIREDSSMTRSMCVKLVDVDEGLERNVSIALLFVELDYATQGDFSIVEDSLVFFSNSTANTTLCFTFSPVNDDIIEGDEVFTFTALTANELDVFMESASDPFIIVIYNDDGVELSADVPDDVDEDSLVPRNLCVRLVGVGEGLEREVKIMLQFVNDTLSYAVHGDFAIEEDSLVFPSNSTINTTSCFTLSPVDDEFIEENELFIFSLNAANELDVFNVSDLFLVTINDNDGASIFLSNPGDDVVTEGDVFMVCANFQSLPLQRNMSVGLSIPVDSQDELQFVTDGEILFTPESEPSEDNTLTSCAFVAAVDNNQIEPEEVVTLMIDPDSLMPNDRAIDPRIVEIIILNNDVASTLAPVLMDNAVFVSLPDITVDMFTDEKQLMFRMETANAINSYCAEKRCKEVEMALLKRQVLGVQADDITLSNIRGNALNGVDFDMFVQSSDNAVLDQQDLLQAVESNTEGYMNAGFPAPSVRPLVPESTAGLSVGAIVGIIIGVLAAAILLIIVIIPVIYHFCITASSRKTYDLKGGEVIKENLYISNSGNDQDKDASIQPSAETEVKIDFPADCEKQEDTEF